MTFVITDPCIDVQDKRCIEQCPVDCIYEGSRALYIHPDECIDCGACEPECPVEAIYFDADVPERYAASIESNRAFFTELLPGRSAPLGMPAGAAAIGPLRVDSSFVASHEGGKS